MKKYLNLDLETLIELLIVRIKEYDRMLSTRVFREEEFAQCKHVLAELHTAIKEKAKRQGYNTDNIFPNYPDWKTTRPASKEGQRPQVKKKMSKKH